MQVENNTLIGLAYDPDAYEEEAFTGVRNFFECQGANVEIGTVLIRALDVPSLVVITLPSLAAICFIKGFFTSAGKDAWKAFKKVLLSTKKNDVPGLDIRIDLQTLHIISGIKINNEVTLEKFMRKFISIELDIKEMTKSVPEGLNRINLQYDEQKNVFEAKGIQGMGGVDINIHFNFESKKWEQETRKTTC